MSYAKPKDLPDIKSPRAISRIAKLELIREVFSEQGKYVLDGKVYRGWDAREQNYYLTEIGLPPTAKNRGRTDEELDLIIADMERHRMILFK